MKLSNDLGLPLPLVAAVQADDYDKGNAEFSTTELISPPRIAVLKKQWSGHLVEDASDRIYALFGKAVHTILEKSAESKRYLVEKRFFHEHDGYVVGGQIDIFDRKTSTLQDWKWVSYKTTIKAKLERPWDSLRTVPEGKGWIEQANINAYLMYRNGIVAKKLQIVCMYRDWNKMMVARGKSEVPPRQVEILRVPRWTYAETETYLSERIKIHLAARTELPMCTEEERWQDPPVWAVIKKGGSRAIPGGLQPTELDAQKLAAASTNGIKKYEIEFRPSEPRRCLWYCPVAGYCSFGRELLKAKAEEAA